MTIIAELFGWSFVAAGFILVMRPGGLGIGACGAVILGLAFAGAFNF